MGAVSWYGRTVVRRPEVAVFAAGVPLALLPVGVGIVASSLVFVSSVGCGIAWYVRRVPLRVTESGRNDIIGWGRQHIIAGRDADPDRDGDCDDDDYSDADCE